MHQGCINFVLVHHEGLSRGMCSRGCIKRVHQSIVVPSVGASRGMCVRGVRPESFLMLCDALRARTAKRGTLLNIKNNSILKCISQPRFEIAAPEELQDVDFLHLSLVAPPPRFSPQIVDSRGAPFQCSTSISRLLFMTANRMHVPSEASRRHQYEQQ